MPQIPYQHTDMIFYVVIGYCHPAEFTYWLQEVLCKVLGIFLETARAQTERACFSSLSSWHAFCSLCSLWGLGERRFNDKAHAFREERSRWKQIRVKQKALGENVFTNGYRTSPVYFMSATSRLWPIDVRVLTAIHCPPRKGHAGSQPTVHQHLDGHDLGIFYPGLSCQPRECVPHFPVGAFHGLNTGFIKRRENGCLLFYFLEEIACNQC